nr:MAG TPA: hypothetical protein [Caudoviricetes sp.]
MQTESHYRPSSVRASPCHLLHHGIAAAGSYWGLGFAARSTTLGEGIMRCIYGV